MPLRDPQAVLHEMLDVAKKARWVFEQHRREDLDDDWESAFALRLALQILGEAAGRIPKSIQDENPKLPWNEVVGLRHVLVHGYDAVDLDILWKIAEKDLPPLLEGLEELLTKLGQEERPEPPWNDKV